MRIRRKIRRRHDGMCSLRCWGWLSSLMGTVFLVVMAVPKLVSTTFSHRPTSDMSLPLETRSQNSMDLMRRYREPTPCDSGNQARQKQYTQGSVLEEYPSEEEFELRKHRAFIAMGAVQGTPRCVYPDFDPKESYGRYHYFDTSTHRVTTTLPNRRRLGQLPSSELEPGRQMDSVWDPDNLRPRDDSDVPLLRRLDQDEKGTIAFIHIGKTAGTTISRFLVAAQREYYGNTIKGEDFLTLDSEISRQVDCVVHNHNVAEFNGMETPPRDRFLISVRHPVKRMQSWFDYEHHWENEFCGKAMVYTCYDTFEQLATEGLHNSRPSSRVYSLRMNLTKAECSHWAWGAIQGEAAANAHNFWNYEKYSRSILSMKKKEIYVIRQEHLWEDWMSIDSTLGGTGRLPAEYAAEARLNAKSTKTTVLSVDGRRNVCKALCDEIQVYKQLLNVAANLDDKGKRTSLRELQELCPKETSLETRSCSYS